MNTKHLKFTKEQEKWLIDNYYKVDGYKQLTDNFNKKFKTNRNIGMISDKCTKSLKLKGIKNKSLFGQGKQKDDSPVGTITTTKTGYTYIKIKESKQSYSSGYREPYWKALQKKIWEDAYGECQKGSFVIFLDGNIKNFKLENLYCIDRKVSAVLARNGWYSNNADITLTAIKYCELLNAVKSQKKRSGKNENA